MASNETVASVADCIRHLADNMPIAAILNIAQCNFTADRIIVAHKREMEHRALIAGVTLADAVDEAHERELAAKDDEIAKLRDTINMDSASMAGKDAVIAAKDDERLTIVANYENVIAAKNREIAELREKMGDDDLLKMARDIDKLRAKLKVAEDALEAASDAFRFCIEQCELELGPRMIGKLCDDGKAVERALAAIRGEGGAK